MKEQGKATWHRLGLLLAAVIWGSGFIATQYAVDSDYSPAFILLVRYFAASVILWLIFGKRLRHITPVEWRSGGLAGFAFFMGFLLQTYGLIDTTPSMNAFITATSVMMVPLFVWIFFKEKPLRVVFISCIISFFGVLILSLESFGSFNFSFGKGEILTFASAIAFALHTVFIGYHASRMDPIRLTFIQTVVAAVSSLIYFLIADRDFSQFALKIDLWSIFYLAIFSTLICFLLQTWGLSRVPSSQAVVILSGESLFATIFSVALGFDPFRWQLVFGGGLILGAILLTEIGGRRTDAMTS